MICRNCAFEFEGEERCPQCGTPVPAQNKPLNQTAEPEKYESVENEELKALSENESVLQTDGSQNETTGLPEGYAAAVPESVSDRSNYQFQNEDDFPPYDYNKTIPFGDTAIAEPKKSKGKIAAIVIAIVVVFALALTAVAAFTDVFVSKKSSFTSLSTDCLRSIIDPVSEVVAGNKCTETNIKLSVGENAVSVFGYDYGGYLKNLISELNGISLNYKIDASGESKKMTACVKDSGGELIGISTAVSDTKQLIKFSFSEVGLKTDFSDYPISEAQDLAALLTSLKIKQPSEKLKADMEKAFSEAFMNSFDESEFVKSEYVGAFAVNADAITVKMTPEKAVDVLLNMVEAGARVPEYREYYNESVMPILEAVAKSGNLDEIGLTSYDYDSYLGYLSLLKSKLKEGLRQAGLPNDITFNVSVLYNGSFAFSRKVIGLSLSMDVQGRTAEILLYDNGKDRAVYGFVFKGNASESFSVSLNNDYSLISGGRKGKITIGTSGALLPGTEVYEIIRNLYVEYEISGNNKRFDAVYNHEGSEMVRLTAEIKSCEPFDVNIDESNCIDLVSMIESGDSASEDLLDKLSEDFESSLQSLQDRPIVSILTTIIGSLTQYNDYGLDLDDSF